MAHLDCLMARCIAAISNLRACARWTNAELSWEEQHEERLTHLDELVDLQDGRQRIIACVRQAPENSQQKVRGREDGLDAHHEKLSCRASRAGAQSASPSSAVPFCAAGPSALILLALPLCSCWLPHCPAPSFPAHGESSRCSFEQRAWMTTLARLTSALSKSKS